MYNITTEVLSSIDPKFLARKQVTQRFNKWYSDFSEWRDRAFKAKEIINNDVYDGTAFTKEELENIKKFTSLPISINRLYAQREQKLGILMETKPSYKIIGTNKKTLPLSHQLDKAKDSILYYSSSNDENRETITDMIDTGLGYKLIEETDESIESPFEVTSNHVSFENIIPDSQIRSRDTKDIMGFFIQKTIDVERAEMVYGDYFPKINTINGKLEIKNLVGMNFIENIEFTLPANSWTEDSVLVTEYYYKKKAKLYIVEDMQGQTKRVFKENLKRGEQLNYKFKDAEVRENWYWVREIYIGSILIGTQYKTITHSPLIIYIFNWGGRLQKSYGIVHHVKSIYDGVNKLVQYSLIHGLQAISKSYIAPEGVLTPEQKRLWENHGTNPFVVKTYTLKRDMKGNAMIPERERVENMSNFFPWIIGYLENSGQQITGITGPLEGNPDSGKIEVFSTLQQYINSGMKRIGLDISAINSCQEREGLVTIEYILEKLKPENEYMLRSYADDEGFEIVTFSSDVIEALRRERPAVFSIPSKYTPEQEFAMATSYMNIAGTTRDPAKQELYIEHAAKLSGMKGIGKIIKEHGIIADSNNKLNSMNELIKNQNEAMDQLEAKLITSEINRRVAEKLLSNVEKLAKMEGSVEQYFQDVKKSITDENRETKKQ